LTSSNSGFSSVLFIALIIISICSKYLEGILTILILPASSPEINVYAKFTGTLLGAM
jgi:hypothetical protein